MAYQAIETLSKVRGAELLEAHRLRVDIFLDPIIVDFLHGDSNDEGRYQNSHNQLT